MTDFPQAIANGWFPVARTDQLSGKPVPRALMGVPIVLFSAPDGPVALVDRCPHRNMALSRGRVHGGAIECPYHGWRFGPDGGCTLTPGADRPAALRAETLPLLDRQGLLWTSLAPSPGAFPVLPHPIGDDRFDGFWWAVEPSTARIFDAVENLLDPAHPHFIHARLVRSGAHRRPVQVTVTITPDRAEAVYVENALASGIVPRMLEGRRTASIGRFFPPTTGQITFEGPSGPRLAITVFFTPESRDRVRPFAYFATPKGLLPAFLKKWLLLAFNYPIMAQDADALRRQHQDIARFGAPKFGLGPLDFLLPAIRTLAAGDRPEREVRNFTIQL